MVPLPVISALLSVLAIAVALLSVQFGYLQIRYMAKRDIATDNRLCWVELHRYMQRLVFHLTMAKVSSKGFGGGTLEANGRALESFYDIDGAIDRMPEHPIKEEIETFLKDCKEFNSLFTDSFAKSFETLQYKVALLSQPGTKPMTLKELTQPWKADI